VAPHIVVLNHKSGHAGVAAIYNHATYKEEKVALARWADIMTTWRARIPTMSHCALD
jgi:hypothetical protein